MLCRRGAWQQTFALGRDLQEELRNRSYEFVSVTSGRQHSPFASFADIMPASTAPMCSAASALSEFGEVVLMAVRNC